MDRPEPGKVYRLTGGAGVPAISNGNTWAESDVSKHAHAPDAFRDFRQFSDSELRQLRDHLITEHPDLATARPIAERTPLWHHAMHLAAHGDQERERAEREALTAEPDPDRCDACGMLQLCDCRVYLT